MRGILFLFLNLGSFGSAAVQVENTVAVGAHRLFYQLHGRGSPPAGRIRRSERKRPRTRSSGSRRAGNCLGCRRLGNSCSPRAAVITSIGTLLDGSSPRFKNSSVDDDRPLIDGCSGLLDSRLPGGPSCVAPMKMSRACGRSMAQSTVT